VSLAAGLSPVTAIFADFVDFMPRLAAAFVFISLAFVFIRFGVRGARAALENRYGEPVLVDLGVDAVFMVSWFAAALITLSLLGFEDIAASLGTATGFVALGVSFALKDMIADVVSGIRLIKDEDFQPGDKISAADTEGTVVDIDLRKTRVDLESGDRAVISNKDIEKKWVKKL
jgi:small-conductance mechanosensitive channel